MTSDAKLLPPDFSVPDAEVPLNVTVPALVKVPEFDQLPETLTGQVVAASVPAEIVRSPPTSSALPSVITFPLALMVRSLRLAEPGLSVPRPVSSRAPPFAVTVPPLLVKLPPTVVVPLDIFKVPPVSAIDPACSADEPALRVPPAIDTAPVTVSGALIVMVPA